MAALIIANGARAGERISLDGDIVIGRVDAALSLDDAEVSRRHAVVRADRGGFVLEDLGSKNGTQVDGRPVVEPVHLKDGMRIRIGQVELVFEQTRVETVLSAPAPTAPPAATAAHAPVIAPPTTPVPFTVRQQQPPRRSVASRYAAGVMLTVAAVVGTDAALIAYFALRG